MKFFLGHFAFVGGVFVFAEKIGKFMKHFGLRGGGGVRRFAKFDNIFENAIFGGSKKGKKRLLNRLKNGGEALIKGSEKILKRFIRIARFDDCVGILFEGRIDFFDRIFDLTRNMFI